MLPAATDSHKMLFKFGLIYLSLFSYANASFPYYGTKIGSLKRLHHGVSGDVYAVDSRTIFVKKFNYDGEAPAAYFYVGNTDKPSNDGGVRLRDERGGTASLTRRYRNKDITLTLPEGKTLRDIKWFSVWCDEFAVNFGDVSIPNNLDFPRPQKINGLTGVHGVKSDSIVIVDAQTLLVPNFSYDGEAPDAKFWVGQGDRPTPNGLRIPDENGKENPLRRYDRKTIVLTLPDDLTVFDIGHFGVWCEAFTVDFGHVLVPPNVNVPPSLKMLGISPQSKLNCEVLYDDLAFEVRWAVAGESIVVQLVAKLDNNEYMSFGVSPDKDRSVMIGADVVVAWVDQESGKGYAQDYYLEDKSQCSGKHGSCPDVNILENSNSVRLLNAAMVNGYSIVTYQRSLNGTDKLDLPISTNGPEAIVWAIGPLNERKETSFHTQYTKHTHYIDFGRQPTWNCPMPEGTTGEIENENLEELDNENENDDDEDEESGYPPATKPTIQDALPEEEEFYDNRAQALQGNRRQDVNNNSTKLAQRRPVPTPKPVQNAVAAWDIPPIQCFEPDDGVFYAQMGPTGGKHGYSAITGHVGWGISWYINGLLIPEIHVVRGKTYTFVVEGGNNPDIPAKYHPFYITDDPIGGYEHKSEEEKKNIRIFAGVQRSRSGQMVPTGIGRLCNWTPDIDGPAADDYQSFGAYQRTLTLKCDPGDPGVITWKPDRNTPETVYYHCFTHRYLGWKIHVHDTCDDMRFAASNKYAVSVPAATANREDNDSDASIRYENKVSLNDNFLLKHQSDLIKNHNMNGTPPKLAFELNKSTEITKLISDGIRAAEALEESLLKQSNQPLNEPKPQQQPDASNKTQSNASATSSTLPNGKETTSVSQQQYNSYPQQAGPDLFKGESKLHQFPYNLISAPNTQTYNNKAPLPLPLLPQSSPIPTSQYHLAHLTHLHKYHQQHPHNYHHPTINNLTANLPSLPNSQKTISLSEFLRPPFNAPLFHPVKLPGRRPFPGPGPVKKVPASKPILPQQMPRHPPKPVLPAANGPLSQSSVIVNHYRKPVPSLLRPFMKDKPFPLQPLAASVLLLGQPTELINHRKSEPHIHMKQKPIIAVPYGDLLSQGNLQKPIHHLNTLEKLKKPYHPVKLSHPLLGESLKPVQVMSLSTTTSKTVVEGGLSAEVLKKLFDKADVKDEPSLAEIATMKPAVNEGFKPDTVVVESGFRPILREDGPMPPPEVIEQIASRRDDPGAEIDEVMEAGPLFLAAPKETQTHNFEPMFIPSPPDSTNASIIIRKSTPGALIDKSASQTQSAARPQYQILSSLLKSTKPDSSQLQNATLEDILLGDSKEENDIVREDSYWDESGEVMKDSAESFGKDQDKGNSIFVEEYKESVKPLALESKDPISSNKTIKKSNLLTTIPSISANRSLLPTEETGSLKNVKNHNIVTLGTDREQSEEDIYEDQQNIDLENNYDDDYEAEVQASERIDSFYLPPDNRKPPSSKPPSGTVVTFDGKPLEDSSLVLPPKLESSSSQSRSFGGVSKLEQLMKTTPQFGPFRGEIPPLGIDSVPSVYNAHSSPSTLLASSVQHHKTTKLQALRNGRV